MVHVLRHRCRRLTSSSDTGGYLRWVLTRRCVAPKFSRDMLFYFSQPTHRLLNGRWSWPEEKKMPQLCCCLMVQSIARRSSSSSSSSSAVGLSPSVSPSPPLLQHFLKRDSAALANHLPVPSSRMQHPQKTKAQLVKLHPSPVSQLPQLTLQAWLSATHLSLLVLQARTLWRMQRLTTVRRMTGCCCSILMTTALLLTATL